MIFDIFSLLLPLTSPYTITIQSRTPHLPMPNKDALYRSFNQLLGRLDLDDDKIGEMNSYNDQKKWEMLCSHSLMKVHQSPSFYLQRLRSHVGLKTSKSKTDVTETLRGLEVSLRTYSIDWLRNFLSEKNSLDTLDDSIDNNFTSEQFQILLQSLKVILTDSMGFSMMINHHKLVNDLVKVMPTVSTKNKCTILQLLTMACRKSQHGHDQILKSLKSNGGAEKLMEFLILDKKSKQMVISSTLNLMKAVVNSPIDLNYQVYLQYELRKIGLESRLQRLMLNESNLISEVIEEIKNYESMIINVNQLVKDREAFKERLKKTEATIMDEAGQSINRVRFTKRRKKKNLFEKGFVLKAFALKSLSQFFSLAPMDFHEKCLIKLIHRKFMFHKKEFSIFLLLFSRCRKEVRKLGRKMVKPKRQKKILKWTNFHRMRITRRKFYKNLLSE